MSFIKEGNPERLTIMNTCCICGKISTTVINGQHYCKNHIPKNEDSVDEK